MKVVFDNKSGPCSLGTYEETLQGLDCTANNKISALKLTKSFNIIIVGRKKEFHEYGKC